MKSSMVTQKMNPEHFNMRCECTHLWHRRNDLTLKSENTGFEYKRDKRHLDRLLLNAWKKYLKSCEKNGYEEDIYAK